MELTRPAWLQIDLDRLHYNFREIRKVVPEGSEIMAVLKADAYGHGAIKIARELLSLGVTRFGVATLSEALELRKRLPHAQILVMGYTPEYLYETAIEHGIRTAVYLQEQAEQLSKVAARLNRDAIIHLKIETGMNRLGFLPNEDSMMSILKIREMDNIIVEGIFTHFPAADDDLEYTGNSMRKFESFTRQLEDKGFNIPIKHVNNSAAIMNLPEYSLDMVRAGIILYGVYPFPEANKDFLPLESCLSLRAQISHVKDLEAGERIGYGLTYTAQSRIKVATLPVGYADGWSRELSNKGSVLIGGKRAPIIGRVCMDQLMVDVTGIDAERGEEAVLMGRQGNEEITIEEIAGLIGQIPAAVMCMLSRRLPRVYTKENRPPEVVDYLID